MLLLSPTVFGTVATWQPQYPWQGGSVSIFYNIVEGTLPNNASQVFIHLGYNGWSNTNDHAMTYSGNDVWRFDWTIPADATVIDFVFKDDQGNWDNNGGIGIDWHIPVSEPGLNAVFVEPIVDIQFGDPRRSPLFTKAGDTVRIVVSAVTLTHPLDSLALFVNDGLVNSGATDTLTYDFITDQYGYGFQQIKVVAHDTLGGVDSSAVLIMVNPAARDLPVPAGVSDGINYDSYNSLTLALFAPYKDFIYVIGDFNDWQVDTTFFMNRHQPTADSTLWWLTIDGLSPGTEYAFQYLVDGKIRIADPYTAKVLDPWNDGYIPEVTYPNLKPYPFGKTNEIAGIVQTAQTPFNWVYNDTFQALPAQELIIYEMLVRDFIVRHDYQTLIDTLDYLELLGINAIELMPINEFEGNSSWGYNPSFYFAPDKYYGTETALKMFIDECHHRGIAVIIDLVLNHSYGQSPLARLYWDGANSQPAANNPWYNQEHSFLNPAAHWGSDFNHESVHTEAFVERVNRYWLTEFKIDGFRFDFTKGFSNTIYPSNSWGSDYDPPRIANLKRIADEIWLVNPDAYVILEHLAVNQEEEELSDYGMLLWGNTNYNYNEASMGWHSNGGSDFSWGYYGSRGWVEPHLVTYMESHDEERMMYKNLQYGNSSGSYNIQVLTTAINRMKQAAGFFLTLPGPKMIWQFGERGYDVSINAYGGRLSEKPPRWEYMQDPDRLALYKTNQALLKLRREQPVFRSPDTVVDLWLNSNTGLKRIRLSHSTMKTVIIGNFGVTAQAINPNFYTNGDWYEFFTGDTLTVASPTAYITLGPGELRIYTDQYVEPPEPGLLETDPLEIEVPIEFQLSQNYPNPFNPATVIEFSLPTSGMTNLTIHDLLGREVVTLMNGRQSAGWQSVSWNGQNQNGTPVSAGMYIYTLKTEQRTVSKKLVLLK